MEAGTHKRWIHVVVVGALVGVVWLSFKNALDGTFIWDDHPLIKDNRFIKDFRYLKRNFSHAYWDIPLTSRADRAGRANIYYRPLVTLSFMIDYQLFGLSAWGYHLTNLLLHLAMVLLVFYVASRILMSTPSDDNPPIAAITCVALLFAVHPSRTEAVVWISGRTDLLMSLFWLLALMSFWKALASSTLRTRWLALFSAWLTFFAALLCKEAAVSLAVAVVALDFLLISKTDYRRLWHNGLLCHGPLLIFCAGFVIFRVLMQSEILGGHTVEGIFPRLVLVLQTLAHYGMLIVNPFEPSMQVGAYTNPYQPTWSLVLLGATLLAMGTAGCTLALLRLRRGQQKNPESEAGSPTKDLDASSLPRIVAWLLITFAATLAPVSNLIPLSLHALAADRFLYLPFLFLTLLTGVLLSRLLNNPRKSVRAGSLAIVGLLVVSWGVTTSIRSLDFSSSKRFWEAELAASPNNPLVELNLAFLSVRHRKYQQAGTLFIRSLRTFQRLRQGASRQVGLLLAMLDARLLRTSDFERSFLRQVASFLTELQGATKSGPKHQPAKLRIGSRQLVITIDTEMIRALHLYRPHLLSILGAVQSRLGEDAAAIETLVVAWKLDPDRLEAALNLALAQIRSGDYPKARRTMSQARRLAPDEPKLAELAKVIRRAKGRLVALSKLPQSQQQSPAALMLRAELMIITKATPRACAYLRRVITLDPNNRRAWMVLALELASARQLSQALEVVAKARVAFGAEQGIDDLERRVRALYRRTQ